LTSDGSSTATLSREQVLELAGMVKKVEEYYSMPMDTEWAYAGNRFHMLQARPITTYIPLHPDFLTAPGDKKRLYLDLTLIEQGIQNPLSVLGTDCFRILSNAMGLSAAGVALAEKPGDFIYAAGGRAYVNLSAEMLLEGQKGTAKEYEGLDSYAAQIIREVDMTPYKGKIRPTRSPALSRARNIRKSYAAPSMKRAPFTLRRSTGWMRPT
jgi:pyruvate,water dikinase